MINSIVKFILGKEIVLIAHHRNSRPLINEENKKHFVFVNSILVWRLAPIPGKYKVKFRIVYLILTIINPKYIIDINWITKWQSLYIVWTKKHNNSKFIVIQHGGYVAGIVTDIAHRYAKCDIFLVWSEYYKKIFEEYNNGSKLNIVVFGNPVFNEIKRDRDNYKNNNSGKILLMPTAITSDKLKYYYNLVKKLKEIGFEVFFKGHNFQGKLRQYPKIETVIMEERKTYDFLKLKDYEIIFSDTSSALIDAIFFRNKVLYFSPCINFDKDYKNNIYSEYLENIYDVIDDINSKDELLSYINIAKQEELLKRMIFLGDNKIKEL